jgi:hypothetical protein
MKKVRKHFLLRQINFVALTQAGANDDEVPPVPIPNTEVKLIGA